MSRPSLSTRSPSSSAASRSWGEVPHGQPFPHVVVDGLLNMRPDQARQLPDHRMGRLGRAAAAVPAQQAPVHDIERIPAPFNTLIDELSRPRLLRALEAITGIDT